MMRHRHRNRRSSQRGVTLIELIIAITIVAIGVTSILGALSVASSRSADAMVQQQAVSVAQAYLDEILQRWVVDPNGTPAAGGRATWDTVDAYNGLADTGAHDQFGNAIAALSGYNVAVSVVPSSGLGGIGAAALRRIDVTVTHAPNVTVTLSGYRANF
jgi:MSHA pilin protein MshD